MIIKKVIIENMRSFEKQEINFPPGSTLLSGDIGVGKTTILLSIEFALFGLQPSQKGSCLLRNGADNGKVTLELDIEGKNIIIERTLKRSKKSINQDYASITVNSEKFEGSVTEVKNRILKLLNYPLEFSKKTNLLYKFTVYTPQEEMKQIILEPGDLRLNTLRHIFGIDKYKRIEENSCIISSKLREKIRLNEGILYSLEEEKKILDKKKEDILNLKQKQEQAIIDYKNATELKEQKNVLLKEIEEKIEEKRSLENEKSKSEVLIAEKKQQVRTLDNSINTIHIQITEAKKISFNQDEFNSIDQRIEFQKEKEEGLQKEYMHLIGSINAEESKKRETENLKNKISMIKKCPTCLQEVSDQYKNNIFERTSQEISESQKKIAEFATRKNQIISQIEETKKAKEAFQKRKSELELLKIKLENIKEKEGRALDIEKQAGSIKKDLEILEKHTISLQDSIKQYENYALIFAERKKDLEDAKQKERQTEIKKAEINKEIQICEQQIKEKQAQISIKEDLKKKTDKLREIEYWISEKFVNLVLFTEKQVMFTLKDEFSKLFSRWFSVLVSDALYAKLDDNFSPVIEMQDYELDYSFLSGGERTAIALAYRLALNQIINTMLSKIKTRKLVILDEPTDGFSAQQLDKIRDVLIQLNAEQIIIVSHEQKIEGFVDNIIRISKDSGVTSVN
jgi:DNA repair protein SbcC/Rad50